ncbi:MAG: N-6 DNA methylase [Bacteroidales bacterium]|nr:N-6 DNA methylase [Bacteroidales bacterium]MCF8455320.1 N-6 DNA methylase [Bacteroidales bacterium]
MAATRAELINNFRKNVKDANKESPKKEAFKDLLNRLYVGDKEIERLIDKITRGSETTVLNIPRKDKLHKGSADTLYNKIIIEFKDDLKLKLKNAKEQLAGYLLGQFNSGEGYNFTLIATDCISWKVYAPDISQLEQLENLTEDELILNEVESAFFVLTENNADDFYYWIDRFLFKEQKQRATLKRIEESFGHQGNVFIESLRELIRHFNEVKKYGEVQVSFEQWKKFLSIAYGSFDASETNFLIHTYLSIFSKMLAYSVVSNDDYIDEDEMKGIISGSIFQKYNIQNFVDNDFFHWIGNKRNSSGLKKVFRLIAQEISAYDFNQVDEDILKGVYQELIDLDTRHSLGEYYTPDWLCERVVNEFEFKPGDKILDPACGSGSFLRAAIHRIRKTNPSITVEQINNNIYGIDIHPLSVQIAKTTMLLALGKEITNSRKAIHLNIILANTLLAPEGVKNLFGSEFVMQIDKEKLWLNTQVFEDMLLFDEALEVCEDLAEQSMHQKKENQLTFENNLQRRYINGGLTPLLIENFYKIYETLKLVKEKGRDSIWKFIVQNLYKPYFLSRKFDYVIGNPPWFTFSSIKNEEYQDLLNKLAETYNIKPLRVANFPHLEIAAIFLAYCSSYFLNEGGKIAFVLPRSFFSADHHDNTRSGKATGFRLTQIWDMESVSPLFRIPSCVLFADKENGKKALPASGIDGTSFSGKLPAHNCNLETAIPKLKEESQKWFYVRQGKSTAFSTRKTKTQTKVNPYKKLFKQGATIVPRTFYFVELPQEFPPDWDDRVINIKTSEDIQADAKAPWKGLKYSGQIESEFVFRTALAKSILPFALYKPTLVVLPIIIGKNDMGEKEIKICSAHELLEEGNRFASKWFTTAERIWDIHKTEKSKNMSSVNRLDFQRGLTSQNLYAPYLVLYNSSAKDANATVVMRDDFDLEFMVESVSYVYYTNSLPEAFYLTAILNSTAPNLMMKDFQAKGLFGARHVHKKILDIYFPKFDENDRKHAQLAKLGETAHEKANAFLAEIDMDRKIEGVHLGRVRLDIKKHLEMELKEIDKIVKQIIK